MIGIPSLLSRAGLVLIFLVPAVAASRAALRQRRAGPMVGALLFATLATGMVVQLLFNARYLGTMRRLRPGELAAVVVGAARIEEPAGLAAVAECGRSITWFDGRRGAARAFELVYRDGRRTVWRVAPLGNGAVIDFGLTRGDVGLYRGAGYLPCLSDVFRRHGVPWPDA